MSKRIKVWCPDQNRADPISAVADKRTNRGYPTEADALKARAARMRSRDHHGLALRPPFHCIWCGQWHLVRSDRQESA